MRVKYLPLLTLSLATTAIGGLLVGRVLSLFYRPTFYVWAKGKS